MEATQLLRVMQQGLGQQQLMEAIRQQQAPTQQLKQAWCASNTNIMTGETVSASAVEDERVRTPRLRSFCTMSIRMGVRCAASFSPRFPKVTHARAGNLQIHRRACFLHAQSNLESVITLRSGGSRDLLVFDGCFFVCDQNTRLLSQFVRHSVRTVGGMRRGLALDLSLRSERAEMSSRYPSMSPQSGSLVFRQSS